MQAPGQSEEPGPSGAVPEQPGAAPAPPQAGQSAPHGQVYLPAGNQSASVPPGPPPGMPLSPSTGTPVVAGSRPTNTLAVVSLAAGIAGYVLPHPFIAGLVAIFTGHAARRQIRQTGEEGATMALVGLILGYVHLALSILLIGVLLLVVVGFFAALSGQGTPR